MYSLWARKRPVNGRGFPYEWLLDFEREDNKYYVTDLLDREIYQECMVLEGERLILYREFDIPYKVRRKRR